MGRQIISGSAKFKSTLSNVDVPRSYWNEWQVLFMFCSHEQLKVWFGIEPKKGISTNDHEKGNQVLKKKMALNSSPTFIGNNLVVLSVFF